MVDLKATRVGEDRLVGNFTAAVVEGTAAFQAPSLPTPWVEAAAPIPARYYRSHLSGLDRDRGHGGTSPIVLNASATNGGDSEILGAGSGAKCHRRN
jgi:hypothetical protein